MSAGRDRYSHIVQVKIGDVIKQSCGCNQVATNTSGTMHHNVVSRFGPYCRRSLVRFAPCPLDSVHGTTTHAFEPDRFEPTGRSHALCTCHTHLPRASHKPLGNPSAWRCSLARSPETPPMVPYS